MAEEARPGFPKMRKMIAATLIPVLLLSGCGMARGLFGGNGGGDAAATEANPLIPARTGGGLMGERPDLRGLAVDQITALVIEPVPGGAILRVEAQNDRQGSFNVTLLPATVEDLPVDGVLAYTLVAEVPARTRIGTPASRRIVAARALTADQLAGVREIRVSGARNSLTARR